MGGGGEAMITYLFFFSNKSLTKVTISGRIGTLFSYMQQYSVDTSTVEMGNVERRRKLIYFYGSILLELGKIET
jgi:hypothetical protein